MRRPRSRATRAFLLPATLLIVSCGAPLMELPSGPGGPAPDARAVVAEATRACRAVATVTAELAVSGSVGGRRTRGRLLIGLAPPASARLEAVAPFGQPFFIFAARDGEATLLLTRERRVLQQGRPDAVLEAVTGVPLDAGSLRTVLIGCTDDPQFERVRSMGEQWRMAPEGFRRLYFRRESRGGPWRLVASVQREPGRPEWRAEYNDFEGGLPRSIRLVSSEPTRFSLRLVLSQLDTAVELGPEAFEVVIPPTANPITLDELRATGPLAGAFNGDER